MSTRVDCRSGVSRDPSPAMAGDAIPANGTPNWIAQLRDFARPPVVEERCELCGERLADRHAHLAEPAAHRIHCACRACALLFSGGSGRFRVIPDHASRLDGFTLTDIQWASLRLPVNLAFFFYSTPEARVIAFYPSPGGPTQSQLSLAAWHEIAATNPVLDEFQADVEALLINRMDGARDCYRVPIDRCYALAGLIRRHWRGFSGGDEVKTAINDFCEPMKGANARARA